MNISQPPYEGKDYLTSVTFNSSNVQCELRNLNIHSAPGSDGISPWFLKKCSDEISYPLSLIFAKSMNENQVPNDWKTTNITPIYKGKGSKLDPHSYRPINLCSTVCKVMERIIKKSITNHLEKNELINPTQHGFQKNKSCTSNLLAYFDKVTSAVDKGKPADFILLDFKKAFDKVPFDVILKKLKSHGITGDLFEWLKSWLVGRKQRVVLNGISSTWEDVLSSIIQGSVLSSVLFVILINDIDSCLSNTNMTIYKFADDSKFGGIVTNDEERKELQDIIDKILIWSENNGMEIHPQKSQVLHFGFSNKKYKYFINGNEIPSAQETRDLGVIVSSDCKPYRHINTITKRAFGTLAIINRNFSCKSKSSVMTMYKSLVLPILSYASPVWCPWYQKDIDMLERVQRRATRMIPGLGKHEYEDRLKICDLESLEDRRIKFDLVEAYKILNNTHGVPRETFFTYICEVHNINTRSADIDNLVTPISNLEIRRNFFSQRVVPLWNNLPIEVRYAENTEEFKKKYNNYKEDLQNLQ